ncbi:hypothetical protein SUGI_0211930 [Cryptomeria japonica]|uniref:probable inactive purple acid phosphatase 16 n=1 Tax=Cryptomeria japonica TaxID=3369 RepID=UPI0024089EA6|nr:probable inactive purple acid phosphatase 16 [Cryptomeria japonica]GLJ13420.1 hypothetical protein SUGI_0211930 [Cryptomeria japonica]
MKRIANSLKQITHRHKNCIQILFIYFHATLVFGADAQVSKKLGFASANSSFRIAIFADLHYGESASTDWGPQQDQNSTRVMYNVLHSENPDFVVYLGDFLTANNILIKNATKYWEQAILPAKSRNVPWASVFGNHDDTAFEWPEEWFGSSGVPRIECPDSSLVAGSEQMGGCYFQGTTRIELLETDAQHNLSYSSYGPESLWPSVSNYVLEIASYRNPKSPAALLYFLDSGGGSYPELISNSQARWFRHASAQRNPSQRIAEIIFWHIPSQAYQKIAPHPGSLIKYPCVGSINLEPVASQVAEWGIMNILINRESVKAVFVGHNHGLDWCCPCKSLWLCFARHTGYGGYGTWPKGARILELFEKPFELKSWIRMEDGTTHSPITLAFAS